MQWINQKNSEMIQIWQHFTQSKNYRHSVWLALVLQVRAANPDWLPPRRGERQQPRLLAGENHPGGSPTTRVRGQYSAARNYGRTSTGKGWVEAVVYICSGGGGTSVQVHGTALNWNGYVLRILVFFMSLCESPKVVSVLEKFKFH